MDAVLDSNYIASTHSNKKESYPAQGEEDERKACTGIIHGFHIRHPPAAHTFTNFITSEAALFQTIHMGRPTIDHNLWRLKVHGLVEHPHTLTLSELHSLPCTEVTSFLECYGSPLKPPDSNVWRIGNVSWTGVCLSDILARAGVKDDAEYVWSDGLEYGEFGGVTADRYQKDLPIRKAMQREVLVAYKMNGRPLGLERGGPVRLVVPGWFGTNSTKWLCSLQVREKRSPGPFTTKFYNELIPRQEEGGKVRPVWEVEPNSMIVSPRDGDVVLCGKGQPGVRIWGWAWSCHEVAAVEVSVDGGLQWEKTQVLERSQFEWQKFETVLHLTAGRYTMMSRATSTDGLQQPMEGRRNHVHSVSFIIRSAS